MFSAKQKYTERGPQKKRPRPASGGRDRDTLTLRVVAANTQNRGNEAEMGKSEREREREKGGRLVPVNPIRHLPEERKEGSRHGFPLLPDRNENKNLSHSQCVFLLSPRVSNPIRHFHLRANFMIQIYINYSRPLTIEMNERIFHRIRGDELYLTSGIEQLLHLSRG